MGCRLTRSVAVNDGVLSHRHDDAIAPVHCRRHASRHGHASTASQIEPLLQQYAAPHRSNARRRMASTLTGSSQMTPILLPAKQAVQQAASPPTMLSLEAEALLHLPLHEMLRAAAESGGEELVLIVHELTAGAVINHISPSSTDVLGWRPSEITGRPASFWYAASAFSRLRSAEQHWRGCVMELQALLQSFEHWQTTAASTVFAAAAALASTATHGATAPIGHDGDRDAASAGASRSAGQAGITGEIGNPDDFLAVQRAQDMVACLWRDASEVCGRYGYRLLRLIPQPVFPHRDEQEPPQGAVGAAAFSGAGDQHGALAADADAGAGTAGNSADPAKPDDSFSQLAALRPSLHEPDAKLPDAAAPPLRWSALFALGYFAEHLLMGEHVSAPTHTPAVARTRAVAAAGGGVADAVVSAAAAGQPHATARASNAAAAAACAHGIGDDSEPLQASGNASSSPAGYNALRVSTRRIPLAQAASGVGVAGKDGFAHAVSDTGAGLPAADEQLQPRADSDACSMGADDANDAHRYDRDGLHHARRSSPLLRASKSDGGCSDQGALQSQAEACGPSHRRGGSAPSGSHSSWALAGDAEDAARVAGLAQGELAVHGRPLPAGSKLLLGEGSCDHDGDGNSAHGSDATTVRSPLEERGSIDGRPLPLRHCTDEALGSSCFSDGGLGAVGGAASAEQRLQLRWREQRRARESTSSTGLLSVGHIRAQLSDSESISSSMIDAMPLLTGVHIAHDSAAEGSAAAVRSGRPREGNTSFTTAASRAHMAHRRYRKLYSYALVLVPSANAVAAATCGGQFCSIADQRRAEAAAQAAAAGAHAAHRRDGTAAATAHPAACPCLSPVDCSGSGPGMEQLLQRGAIIGFNFPAVGEACTSSVHACGAPPSAAQCEGEPLTINGVTPADVAACAARFAALERTFWRPSPPGLEAAHLLLRGIRDKRIAEALQSHMIAALGDPQHSGQGNFYRMQHCHGALSGEESIDQGDDAYTAECSPAVTPMVPVLRFGGGRAARGGTLKR